MSWRTEELHRLVLFQIGLQFKMSSDHFLSFSVFCVALLIKPEFMGASQRFAAGTGFFSLFEKLMKLDGETGDVRM